MSLTQVPGNFGCPRADCLSIQRWPDGVVVYDDASGSLHALTPVAGEAFEWVVSGRASDATGLAQVMGIDNPSADDVDMFRDLLVQFEAMGLIECTRA